jgi:hypothetical protein
MEDFARPFLFEPLGIDSVIFTHDKTGITNGWGDSYWLTEDLLKIGQLLLDKGKWKGEQLLSESWVNRSSTEFIRLEDGESYGYAWWIPNELPGLYEGRGRADQRLVVYPEEELVVIMTGTGFDPGELGGFIIRSLVSKAALPQKESSAQKLNKARLAIQQAAEKTNEVLIPPIAQSVDGQVFTFENNSFGLKAFSLSAADPAQAFLKFDLDISRSEEYGWREVPLGMQGQYRISGATRFRTPLAAHASWLGANHIYIDYNDFSSNHKYRIDIVFENEEAIFRMYDEAGFDDTLALRARIR